MDQAAAVGVRPRKPKAEDDGPVGALRIERLPGVGERTLAEVRLVAVGDLRGGHAAAPFD